MHCHQIYGMNLILQRHLQCRQLLYLSEDLIVHSIFQRSTCPYLPYNFCYPGSKKECKWLQTQNCSETCFHKKEVIQNLLVLGKFSFHPSALSFTTYLSISIDAVIWGSSLESQTISRGLTNLKTMLRKLFKSFFL